MTVYVSHIQIDEYIRCKAQKSRRLSQRKVITNKSNMSKTSEREYPEKQIAVGKAGFVVQ